MHDWYQIHLYSNQQQNLGQRLGRQSIFKPSHGFYQTIGLQQKGQVLYRMADNAPGSMSGILQRSQQASDPCATVQQVFTLRKKSCARNMPSRMNEADGLLCTAAIGFPGNLI